MLVFNALDRDPRVWKESATLAAQGATVTVYMLRGPGQSRVEQPFPGVTVRRITAHSPTERRPRALLGGLAVLQAVMRDRVDVWHCHDGATLPWGALASRRQGATLIYDAHEFFPGFSPDRSTRLRRTAARFLSLDRLGEKWLIRKADHVVTVNRSVAAMLTFAHKLGTVPTVLQNTVPYWCPDGTEVGVLRNRIAVSIDTPVLLFQGGANPARGVDDCIRVLGEIPEAHFVSLGPMSDSDKERLERLSHQLGVQDRVHLLKPVPYDELLRHTADATIGLYLPRQENMTLSYQFSLPNKIFEFIMARVPSVMLGLPELKAILEDRGCGATVTSADPHHVAAAVRRLLSEDPQVIASSLDLAARSLSWEAEADRLLDLYRTAAAEQLGPASVSAPSPGS